VKIRAGKKREREKWVFLCYFRKGRRRREGARRLLLSILIRRGGKGVNWGRGD